jgi:hypothetical protein
LIFATTAKRDPNLQDYVRGLGEPFAVEVWFWDDIERELCRNEEVYRLWEPALGGAAPLVDVRKLPSSIFERLIGRDRELERLDAAWAERSIRVLSVVALGGAGKTALVHHWMQRFEEAGWKAKGAAAAFAWSFYSQGGGDARQASGDLFISEALGFFGDRDPVAGSPRDRGVRLAEHVRRRRTLLILDGLEPLQEPPSSAVAGRVKDPAVAALLLQLASDNPGLLVLTTREPVAELKSREGRGARAIDLDRLGDEAGAALLRWLGVEGREDELRRVAHEVHGHALTLTLLGTYLRDARKGDVRAWKDLPLLAVADLIGNEPASRVMAAYSDWFGPGPERQILSAVGLFDRPAAAGLVAALREDPAIPGVTDELVGLAVPRWNLALTRLRKARLLLEDDGTGALDAHPLVREHFGRRLREESPAAWEAAHGRLFDHLKESTEHWPDTLEGLQPLYQAVVHGCQAGRQQKACDEVYFDRILRGKGRDGFYSTKRLGAIGADLGAVACFFDPPWSHVSPALTEADRAWLLSEAAMRLRALGRLTETVEPMRAGLEMLVNRDEWKRAAGSAGNLSELELTLGDLAGALRDAERSRGWSSAPRWPTPSTRRAAGTRRWRASARLRRCRRSGSPGTRCSTRCKASSTATCSSPTPSARPEGGRRIAAPGSRATRPSGGLLRHSDGRSQRRRPCWISPSSNSPSAAPGSTGRSSSTPRLTPPRPRSTRPSTASAAPAPATTSPSASSPAPGSAPPSATRTAPVPTSPRPGRSPSAAPCPSSSPTSTSTAPACSTTAPPSPRPGAWSRSTATAAAARSWRTSKRWRTAGRKARTAAGEVCRVRPAEAPGTYAWIFTAGWRTDTPPRPSQPTEELLVVGVASYEEPDDEVPAENAYGSVILRHTDRVDRLRRVNLLKAQARMMRTGPKEAVRLSRSAADIGR